MNTYKITANTNGYLASRDVMFNGRTTVILEDGLTLKDAQAALLNLFNEYYEACLPNWGMARCHYRNYTTSHADGTRSFEWDSRYFRIELEGE